MSTRTHSNNLRVEAERRGWGRAAGGYEYEDAELYPLKPRAEWIYDETEDEWRIRVNRILDHHETTGEWLEQPEKTLMERIQDEMVSAFYRSTSPIANALVTDERTEN